MSAPRFLLSSVVLPWPPDQGSKRFTLELARTLRTIGEVSWISRATPGHEAAREALEAEGFRVRLDTSWSQQGWLARLGRRLRGEWEALRRGIPRVQTYACTPVMRALVCEELDRQPDTIVVGAYWHQAPALAEAMPGRRVLVLADLEYHCLAEKLGRDPEGPLPARAERLRRAEKQAFLGCDALLTITELDRALAEKALQELPESLRPRLGVWPAVIPVPEEVPALRPRGPDESQRWLIYGHWSADFNRDGLDEFMQRIWPGLQRGVEAPPRLQIAGGGLDDRRRARLEQQGAEVLGWVEDLEACLAACDVVAVPLGYAGGLRYRMLEAMAAGRPLICTPVAARGSGAVAEEHYLEAETPVDWIRAWRSLRDPERAQRLADAGRAFVAEHYAEATRSVRVRVLLSRTLGEDIVSPRDDKERGA